MTATLGFVRPPAGLEPLTLFTLSRVDGADGLYSLRSTENEAIRLFVLDAAVYLPDYSPEITDEQSSALELGSADDAMVLVVANPGPNGTFVNLLAPIVINTTSGASAQVILEDQDWPLQAELSGARA